MKIINFGWGRLLLLAALPFLLPAGCAKPGKHLAQADRTAYEIIAQGQEEALGRQEPFTIDRPSVTFREKLFLVQDLPYSHPASLGSGHLSPPPAWPELDLERSASEETLPVLRAGDEPFALSMVQALQVGARNSQEYQAAKEEIFRAALDLDLERQEFRHTLNGFIESFSSADLGAGSTVAGLENSTSLDWGRKFQSGLALTTRLGLDLVKLLTLDRASSLGLFADTSISIPLLRGRGREVAAEPLTQAERNVLYAIYRFERFKASFAVRLTEEYLSVLQQLDQVNNTRENYRNLLEHGNRAKRLAEAGRLPEIQVDQARQDGLRARDRWLRASQAYNRRLDGFKGRLGLPPDAGLTLVPAELQRLAALAQPEVQTEEPPAASEENMRWLTEGKTEVGRFRLELAEAVQLALEKRTDLLVQQEQVYDAQRQVVVAADGLASNLNLVGRGRMGERRSLGSAGLPAAELRPERGFFSALLELDWPRERTSERNALRKSLLTLERFVRDLQQLEDQVKLEVRNGWRDLAESRERIRIQAEAVAVARRRVAGAELFLQAGRVQMRDLLEAREALVSAQNGLSAARVAYRVAELALLRDMGVLGVDHQGLYRAEMDIRKEDHGQG